MNGHENGTARAQTEERLPGTDLSAGNLDKIRDILFGAQQRETDRRVAHLEERLISEMASLRADILRRQEALESFVKVEFEELAGRISADRASRAVFEEKSDKTQRDLRQHLSDQSSALSDELHRRSKDLLQMIERHAKELRGEKVDRAQLSSMLSELSMRLSGTLRLPDDGG